MAGITKTLPGERTAQSAKQAPGFSPPGASRSDRFSADAEFCHYFLIQEILTMDQMFEQRHAC